MSENFYEEGGPEDAPDGFQTPVSLDPADQVKKYHTRQSKKLPHWAWRILITLLGIKTEETDKAIVGKIVFIITGALAAIFVSSFIWYTVYDIQSHYTKSNTVSGTVSIILVLLYCGMGLYAHRLARNLFRSKKLVESVRLHSKTIFKISASLVLIILGVSIVTLNNLSAHNAYKDSQCRNISLSVYVCRTVFASRVAYSVLNLFWNLVVGFVVLSVCRTHTIGIRRFIRELEDDGRVYEQLFRQEIIEQLQQLQGSEDLMTSVAQSSLYTAANDNFLSDYDDDDDQWAEDDPLVEELTFYPRKRASIAQNMGSGPFARKRMLFKQASVSSINPVLYRSISRNQSERSFGLSRHNSSSSQDEDVFHSAEHTRQPTPRSLERHYLSRPMEPLVERSTENLNFESTPLNSRQNTIEGYHGYGAIGGNPNVLMRQQSTPETKRKQYADAGSESTLKYTENTIRHSGSVDDNCTVMVNGIDTDITSIPVMGNIQITEDFYRLSDDGNSKDTEPLLTSEGDRSDKDTKRKTKKLKKPSKEKVSSSKKKNLKDNKNKDGDKDQKGSKDGSQVEDTETKDDVGNVDDVDGVVHNLTRSPGVKGVNVSSVIDSLEGRKSVEGPEREMKEKLKTYISSCSSDDEKHSVASSHSSKGKPADLRSLSSWDAENLLLTNEEIFLAYWKISCRLRATSLALQRWLIMWVCFILLWCAAFLVELVSHDSKITEIGQFILTILLIPLVCSAYGEVNNEGSRMIKSICPMPSRVDVLFILNEMPLQITAFGFVVSYSSIVTTLGALGLAFFTKLLLDDLNW